MNYCSLRHVTTFLLVLLIAGGPGCGFSPAPSSDFTTPQWNMVVEAPPFCPPLPPPGTDQNIEKISSGDIRELLWYVRNSAPHTTLLLEDGVYSFQGGKYLEIDVPWITIRSASGNRDAVILEGAGNNLTISATGVTIADVTLRGAGFHGIQVRGELGVSFTRIYNVHIMDSGQQLVKVSTGDGRSGRFADNGLLACSLLEYTTYSQGTNSSAPSYTNGIDILAGKGWVIRDNVFRRIRSQAGPAGPAILVWKNALDTVIRRNRIVDCWRGIALGLMAPNALSRGGPEVIYDHQHGVVENNVILALHEPADAAIENSYARNSYVAHNTIFYNPAIKHVVSWSIEYRFPPTTAVIQNNLTNFPIQKRHPFPIQNATVEGNITTADASWFRDILKEDVHLVQGAYPIDRGVSGIKTAMDIDGTKRLVGSAPDVGADEFEN